MKMKKVLALFLILALAFTMCACGSSAAEDEENGGALESKQFKLAHESGAEGPQQVYAEAFDKYLQELSDGAYSLQIFTVGQLGDTTACVEQCQQGTLDIAFNGYGTIGSLVAASEVVGLPYLLPSDSKDIPAMVQDSEGLKMVADKMREKNLETINWVCEGANWWSANKEIRTPADWKGVKMRVVSTPLTIAQYDAYGANPTPIAYTETYSALQLGMADAQANPLSCIKDMKFYEQQTHLMDNGSGYLLHALCFNTDVWNSLPEEGQAIVKEAALKANDDFYAYFYDYEDSLTSFFEGEGLTIVSLTPEERAAFAELAEPVYEQYVAEAEDSAWAQQVVDALKADSAKYNG